MRFIQFVVSDEERDCSHSFSPAGRFLSHSHLLLIHNTSQKVRKLQESLETIKYDISSKRKAAALDGVKKSGGFLKGKTAEKMVASCREAKVCQDYIQQLDDGLKPLQTSIQASQDAFTGSEQERDALDKAYVQQQSLTKILTNLEEQMIPANYVTPVPAEYQDLPILTKRAAVEMKFSKAGGGPFDVNGVNYPSATMVMVIDGYTGEC